MCYMSNITYMHQVRETCMGFYGVCANLIIGGPFHFNVNVFCLTSSTFTNMDI
mgnify:CR=1 FL=1